MVDDEPDFQTVVNSWLSPYYEHTPLKDGDELAGALRAGRPDLIILDVHLKDEDADGFELCRRLRATPDLKEVPVLFLTGSQKPEDYPNNMRAGGTSYLMKPISRKQLLTVVSGLLSEEAAMDIGGGEA